MIRTRGLIAGVLAVACTPSPRQPLPPAVSNAPPDASAVRVEGDSPPVAERRPVIDSYHGVRVDDDYRWLEAAAAPEVQKWSDAQNAYARKRLDALGGRDAIRARATELLSATSSSYFSVKEKAGRVFALEERPPKQQAFLVVMKSPEDAKSERVVVDSNTLDPSGGTSIDFYVPSPDGKRVAVSLSAGGSENGTVHVYDVASGKETGDVIPRVNARRPYDASEAYRMGVFLRGTGQLVGATGLKLRSVDANSTWHWVDVNYWLAADAVGRGYATEAARRLAIHAVDDLEAQRVEIRTEPGNVASARVAERLGFRHEGTLRHVGHRRGAPVDLALFALLADERAVLGDALVSSTDG